MSPPVSNTLNPQQIVIPNVSESNRDLMICELGTLIFNTDTSKLNFCDVAFTANATSWSVITSD